MGAAASAISDAVSDLTGSDTLGLLAGAKADPLSGTFTVTGIIFDQISQSLDILGLDSLSKEVGRWSDHNLQVGEVLKGEYHQDLKEIEAYKKQVQEYADKLHARINKYNVDLQELLDRLERLVAFDEIFHMAFANRIRNFQGENLPEIEIMTQQYEFMLRELERLIASLRNEYDFVIGLTEGAFLQKLVGSLIMQIGGMESDLRDISKGNANSATYKRMMNVVIMAIAIVVIIVSIIFSAGATSPLLYVALALTAINTFMTLDGMYANGVATGAIMGLLDFIFNDMLNLDDLIGSDFEKFDKDHEDYNEMVGYVKTALSVGAIIASWGASMSGSEVGNTASTSSTASNTTSETSSYLGGSLKVGNSAATSSLFGVSFSTYAKIYEAYSIAAKAGDIIAQNKHYNDMKDKLYHDYTALQVGVQVKWDKSMMKHYKDSAYFLQDQQEHIDRYIWSMTSQNMYVDPYGTTPVANIRFSPDADARTTSFGFEDVFDETTSAGSKGYFNSILYGGK